MYYTLHICLQKPCSRKIWNLYCDSCFLELILGRNWANEFKESCKGILYNSTFFSWNVEIYVCYLPKNMFYSIKTSIFDTMINCATSLVYLIFTLLNFKTRDHVLVSLVTLFTVFYATFINILSNWNIRNRLRNANAVQFAHVHKRINFLFVHFFFITILKKLFYIMFRWIWW